MQTTDIAPHWSKSALDSEIQDAMKNKSLCHGDETEPHMFGGGPTFSNCRNCFKKSVQCNDPLWLSRPNPDVVAGVYAGTASQRGPVNMPIETLMNAGLNSVDELIRQPLDVQQQFYWDFIPASGSFSDPSWPASSYSTDVWF